MFTLKSIKVASAAWVQRNSKDVGRLESRTLEPKGAAVIVQVQGRGSWGCAYEFVGGMCHG